MLLEQGKDGGEEVEEEELGHYYEEETVRFWSEERDYAVVGLFVRRGPKRVVQFLLQWPAYEAMVLRPWPKGAPPPVWPRKVHSLSELRGLVKKNKSRLAMAKSLQSHKFSRWAFKRLFLPLGEVSGCCERFCLALDAHDCRRAGIELYLESVSLFFSVGPFWCSSIALCVHMLIFGILWYAYFCRSLTVLRL